MTWFYLYERWKERADIVTLDPHLVARRGLEKAITSLFQHKSSLPIRYSFLFQPGKETLFSSPTSHMKFWLTKSGSLIERAIRHPPKTSNPIYNYIKVSRRLGGRPYYTREGRRSSRLRRWEVRRRSRRKDRQG